MVVCKRTVHQFEVDLPQSDACFDNAYLAETTESFCDGRVSEFSFLGGVPWGILDDSTKLAVAKVLGDCRRKRTRVFSKLQSHYLSDDGLGCPGMGQRQQPQNSHSNWNRKWGKTTISYPHRFLRNNEKCIA